MSVERRTLLKTTAAGAVGGPFAGLVAMPAEAHKPPNAGALVPVADERDGAVRLHLPEGSATARSTTRRRRRPHRRHGPPGRHDGMGAFDGPGKSVILVRNHEVNGPGTPFGPGAPYDSQARRHDDHPGDRHRRGDPRLHQPQRHDDELLRRSDAVGCLGHL